MENGVSDKSMPVTLNLMVLKEFLLINREKKWLVPCLPAIKVGYSHKRRVDKCL